MDVVISFFGTFEYWLGVVCAGFVLAVGVCIFFGSYIENRVKGLRQDSRKADAQVALMSLAAFLFLPWIWHLTLPLAVIAGLLWLVWYASQDAFKKEEI